MRALTRAGITAVRDTGSPDLDVTFPAFKRGRAGWPRFFGSGPNLDGHPGGPWQGLRSLRTATEARASVRELAEGGVDFVKLYVWMPAELVRAAADEAHRLGLRVAAHVGHVLTVDEALDLGVDAFEHVRIGRELVPPERREELAAVHPRRHDPMASFAAWRYIDPGVGARSWPHRPARRPWRLAHADAHVLRVDPARVGRCRRDRGRRLAPG